MGVFYGGIAQVIAGIMEWKKNSTFGMTAFLSYGLFWLSFVGIFAFPKWMGSAALDLGATSTALGYYLAAWGMFTALMFVGTLRINRSLQTVFLSLTILFFLLAVGEWTGNETSRRSPAGRASSWASRPCTARSPRCGTSSTARRAAHRAVQEVSDRTTPADVSAAAGASAEGRRHPKVAAPLGAFRAPPAAAPCRPAQGVRHKWLASGSPSSQRSSETMIVRARS